MKATMLLVLVSAFAAALTAPLIASAAGAPAKPSVSAPAPVYPSKPIRWILDYPAGGLSDILARIVGQKLTEAWGHPVVYDARPGASGTIGYNLGAKATPDGYTLIFLSTPFSLNISIYDKLPYDTRNDFAPITLISMYPNLLVTHQRLPVKTVAELTAYAKGKPAGLTYASVGTGSSSFLATELFKKQIGMAAVHVPYNGSGPALIDLIGGRVDFMFVNMPGAMAHIRGSRLRVLAIAAAARSAMLRDVPTFGEAGYPGFLSVGYAGVAAPAKTPRPIIAKLNAEMVRALKMPDVRERIETLGGEPRYSTPGEFKQFLEDEIVRWAPVIKETGVRLKL